MINKHWILIFIVGIIVTLITIFNRDITDINGKLNKSNVDKITNYLNIKYSNLEIGVDDITFEIEEVNAKTLEHDAAIFMSLINDLNIVRYTYNGEVYKYYYDDLNTLFDYKLRDKKLYEINNYYKGLKKEYTFIGTIKGIYHLYTRNPECSDNNYLGEDNDYKYYTTCYDTKELVVLDKKNNRYTIESLISRNTFTYNDLYFYNLQLDKERKDA
jgi:hypothetical protein